MRICVALVAAAIGCMAVGCEKSEPDPVPAPTPPPPPPKHHTASGPTAFAAGSLIIPMQGAYQDQCGVASGYGLLFTVLRANDWLAANGHPRITLHWSYSTTKASPNRCIPTNLNTPPSPSADARWNDGCDIQVSSTTVTPVTLVTDLNPAAANDTNIVTTDTTSDHTLFPGYASKTILHTAVPATNVTTVGYLGAPFVISAADAPVFLAMLSGAPGYTAMTDANNVPISFAQYATPASCNTMGAGHHVVIHRAAVGFTAPDSNQFATLPPRLALLNSGAGVSAGILENYLTNAGLTFTGSFGCPVGSSIANNGALCPNGAVSGTIYDNFSDADLAAGLLTQVDVHGNPKYKSIWTPHWVVGTSPNATQQAAINNVAAFLQDPTHGMTGACASIGSWEGSVDTNNNPAEVTTSASTFLTCVQDNTHPGTCAASQPPSYQGVEQNVYTTNNGKNCTDPDETNAQSCVYFSDPTDPIAQLGDTLWVNNGGHITDARPNPHNNSIFRPGTKAVIGNVQSVNTAAPLGPQVVSYTTFHGRAKGNAAFGNAYYFGGHDYHNNLSGERYMMNTLLDLTALAVAAAPVITEVTRATPIAATIANQAVIVQGSFDSEAPAPVPTTATPSTIASFTFPYITGHVRARTDVSITTTGSTFGSGTVLFDAAAELPPATYAGCPANFTATCRTVFTTTAGSGSGVTRNPTMVFLQDGNADAIGAIGAPSLTTHADRVTFVDRLLAGEANGSAYVPALGGVDRSSVAVIEPSSVAGVSTRPTMIYVGAQDGMLHAFCASVGGSCDVLGRELWAFLPRTQLALAGINSAVIDGSPRVVDAFGDFANTGHKSFRTILSFQTGSGIATAVNQTPAVYSLDVTDPTHPTIVWEFTMADPTHRAAFELGTGLSLASSPTNINGAPANLVVAETNNGGAGSAGVVATAINTETGAQVWQFTYAYPVPPRVAADTAVPASGIPGGAVAVDRTNQGQTTDIVFGDLYGNLWELDSATGLSRYTPTKPLFSFTTDYHPIGAVPAIYSNGGQQFALFASGGYTDPLDSSWSSGTQQIVAVSLSAPAANVTLHETSGTPYVPFTINLAAGDNGFAQALVVGNQVFVTTDSSDVNSSGFGTNGNTGHVYSYNLGTNTAAATVVVAGGAGSLANSGVGLYAASSSQVQRLGTDALSTTGVSVDTDAVPKLVRKLWLRTQ